jgi:D-alanyl-D-alanine carboxypeptidase (penicillin-binding protein 5/6)
MNGYLKELGCQNTQFQNPHGLHHLAHVTTAYDICLVTRRALGLPKFREIVSKPFYMKPGTNKQGPAPIRHTNPLLKEGPFYYPKAIGVKTGFHSHAKNTFVAAAEHEGRTLIGVLLGCAKREDRYQDAIRLFEAAFAESKEESCFFPSGYSFFKELEGAVIPLQAILAEDLKIAYYPSEEPSPRAFIHWEVPSLPIDEGARVGEIHLIDERGALLQKKDLYAKQQVKERFLFWLKRLFHYKT